MTAHSTSAALLLELESSLCSSQQALLHRDISGLEQATRDQIRLRRALEISWTGDPTSAPVADYSKGFEARSEPELAAAILSLRLRVLHLGKVQAAILAREQQWLATLANLVAGPEASYHSAANPRAGIAGRP